MAAKEGISSDLFLLNYQLINRFLLGHKSNQRFSATFQDGVSLQWNLVEELILY